MKELSTEAYKLAAKLNDIAVFEWNLEQDEIQYDELLSKVLGIELPNGKFSTVVYSLEQVHPNERKKMRDLLTFLTQVHPEFGDMLVKRRMDYCIRRASGEYRWIRIILNIFFQAGRAMRAVGCLYSINEDQQKLAQMQHRAERDLMTGLYNKARTMELIDAALADSVEYHALLAIDLDGFKQVNDHLGHLVGDAVILDTALSLKQAFQQGEILGRIGGDEFVAFLPRVASSELLEEQCTRLRGMLRRTFKEKNGPIHVTGSIGIAVAPTQGRDYKTLFGHADAALYESKRRGKDSQVFYSTDLCLVEHEEEEMSDLADDYRQLSEKPLEYIFRMLCETKDASLTVNILLSIFAKYLGVQRAYVFWFPDGVYWPRALFDHNIDDVGTAQIMHDPEVRRQMWKRYADTDYGRFTECDNTMRLGTGARTAMERAKIRAYLECAIMREGHFMGCVGFDDCYGSRIWTRAEHEILSAFANIMQRFLLGQIYFERRGNRRDDWDL